MPFIIHVEQSLRPKGSHMKFFFFFPFSFLHQTGSSKSLLTRKKKKRVILNEMKQTGKAEQSTHEKQSLKNSPNKNHTKHSSHLISCYMHWGSQEHQAPRQQSSEVLAQAPSMWQIHAHTPAHTTDPGRNTHACTGGREPQGGWGEKRAGQKCAINWTLGTQRTLLLQAKQESKLKQRENTE